MKLRNSLLVMSIALALTPLVACAPTPPAHPSPPGHDTSSDGHGKIDGATEVAEAPLALIAIDSRGHVGMLDLGTGESSALDPVRAPLAVASDGRYGFVSTAKGVDIIDSGRWTWDHVDHFHYYQAAPTHLGTVPGGGIATVSTGMLATAGSTGVYFPDTGEAVLIDNAALAEGRISEQFRVTTEASRGIIAPLGDGALVSHGEQLIWHHADGSESETSVPCTDASDSVTTRAALVIACADGAVLAEAHDGDVSLQVIPTPEIAGAGPATDFNSRKGRPVVAALAGEAGFWLLHTRAQTWQFVASERPLARVAAVDDAEGHVLALDTDGRVLVYLANTGTLTGSTDPLIPHPDTRVSLTVDDHRGYLNDPESGVVYEIAFAGEVRVARTLHTPVAAHHLLEVGR